MKKTFDNWLDVIIMIFLMVMSIGITSASLLRINGMVADIGKDKVNIASDHVVYEDVTYTVGDLLLTCIRIDRMCPSDMINVTYAGKTINIDTNSEEILENIYLGAQMVMTLKPATMSMKDWYALPIEEVLVYNSADKTYTYNIKIGG